uniref:Uncharacterized protein n=1 Tax=Timema cristinae TaxID=61476 RepID=A0A7R9H7H5_TIMCR|nr:unnamed protein product [Timema cristinae]
MTVGNMVPDHLQNRVPVKEAKLKDVDKLLSKHFGEGWKDMTNLNYFKIVIDSQSEDTFNFPALNMKLADNELPLGYKLLTAGVSACIADLTTFPLDTAKVRLQHQQYQLLGGGGGGQGVTLITSPNQASISSSATRKASGTAGSCTDGGVIHGVNPCSQVPDYCSPENNS